MGVEEGREGVQPFGLDDLGAVGSASPGEASAAISPSRTTTSWRPRCPRPGRARSPAQDHVARLAGAHVERVAEAHAGLPIGVGPGSPSPSPAGAPAGAGEELLEDRHPHDQAGGDLLGDQRLRRVDRLAGELDAAVDRPGVHQELARVEATGVDLEVAAYSRSEGTKLSLIRSFCIRSA